MFPVRAHVAGSSPDDGLLVSVVSVYCHQVQPVDLGSIHVVPETMHRKKLVRNTTFGVVYLPALKIFKTGILKV